MTTTLGENSLTKEQQLAIESYFNSDRMFFGSTREQSEALFIENNRRFAVVDPSDKKEIERLKDNERRLFNSLAFVRTNN